MTSLNTTKPPIAWYGGKTKLVKWILPVLETYKHHSYIEPFGGAGSVLMAKKPGFDIYNDRLGHVVNLYRVIQNEKTFEVFKRHANLTPYSKDIFFEAKEKMNEPTVKHGPDAKRAYYFFVCCRMSFKNYMNDTWKCFYENPNARSIIPDISAYLCAVAGLDAIHARLRTVQIENMDAIACIRTYSNENALFYCDPPYPAVTRKQGKKYEYEITDAQHEELVETLLEVPGHKVVSTYDNAIYERLLEHGWTVKKRDTICSIISHTAVSYQDRQRTECLYCSPNKGGNLFF
ncbi:MAG: DNA adenine methylase [Planctomycetaceae bacterium]|nr:DNA adenine methylase [Planctomycetaceae bacterium]